jgi:hypothetical protein
MTTLVLVLAAGMAVPGIGPEKVSGEIEQGLDMRGEWRGTLRDSRDDWKTADLATLRGDKLTLPAYNNGFVFEITDEGKGRIRILWGIDVFLGIYDQRGDYLVFSFRKEKYGRPASFKAEHGRLLILHRVKPAK